MPEAATSAGGGPGVQAGDGSPVELYRELPYLGELEALMPLLPAGGSVLDLGCGTGRLGRRLIERGFAVTGVDNSHDMLAWVPAGVVSIRSNIEGLSLLQRFDVVLLASYLINHPMPATRGAFLRCARRHLAPGGVALFQCHSAEWLRSVEPGPAGTAGEVQVYLESVEREGANVRMTLRYQLGARRWRHVFTTVVLTQEQVEQELRAHGFSGFAWHGMQDRWVVAGGGAG